MAWTAEQAREYQAKAVEARAKNTAIRESERQLAAAVEQLQNDFPKSRLARVRSQLIRLDLMMEKETDPQRLDRIASAQVRLAEHERQLAGRPMPGSLRPSRPGRRQSHLAAPVGDPETGGETTDAPQQPASGENVKV